MGKNSTSPPPIKDSRFIGVFSQCAASKSTDPLKSLFSTTFLNWQAQSSTSKRPLRLPPLLDLPGRVDPTHNRSSGLMRSVGLKAAQEAIEDARHEEEFTEPDYQNHCWCDLGSGVIEKV
jgi:hypothetical protein